MTETADRKGRPFGRVVIGIVVLAVIILWSGGFLQSKTAPGHVEAAPGMALPPGAKTATARYAPIAPRIDIVGTTASAEKINLSARIGGYVRELFASAGDAVKKGQVLVTLDDRELREQFAAAEGQHKQAEAEFNRTRQLLAAKAATEQAMTSAESALTAARAQLERARVMLTYAQIASPIDGIVTDRRVEVGDLANPGQPLVSVYAPEQMQIEVPVPVRLVEKLPLGTNVEVTLDRPARVFHGRVREIVSEFDPLSRTQLVKVRIEDAGGAVLPGTFGRIWVEGVPRPSALVPASAVYRVGQLEMVQVARDGRALRRIVRTGPRQGDQVEILSGLNDGEPVLVTPVQEDR
jgi:RND family efflux transporter MFP subunit